MAANDRGIGRRALLLSGVVAVVVGGGAVVDGMVARPAAAAALPAFDNCAQLQQWVDRAAAKESSSYAATEGFVNSAPGVAVPTAGRVATTTGTSASALAPQASPGKAAADNAVGSSATGTNVQEAGVDEPDQVKTDGRHIVGITQGRGLWIAELHNHTPRVVGRLALDGAASSLLLAGDRALVLTSQQGIAVDSGAGISPGTPEGTTSGSIAPRPHDGRSRLVIIDLADARAPRVVASQDVTGSVLTARQVGSVAWVVSESQPASRKRIEPPSGSLLPKRTVRDSSGAVVTDDTVMSCSAVRHPTTLSGSQLLTVQPVDITASSPFTKGRSAGVVASGGIVYASANRLYVATTTWGSAANTQIHAFNISDGKQAKYAGSGSVTGTLLSQWSMSEQNGFLRVASTRGSVVPPPGEGDAPARADTSESLVTILAEQSSKLVRVGRVGGLGRGERVFAVRWLGNLAAVVTFRQTDPLYLLDVTKPTAPRLLGELKITGYSAYLHPVGDGLLLGVGHEADTMGRIENAKATLFDVRDPAHPRKVDSLDLGRGWSDVEGDSHAFTYLPSKRLALLPLMSEDGSVATSIAVTPSGVSAAGRLVEGGQVQRFVPVGDAVVALGFGRLSAVDPVSLDVLGAASLL
ncbi:MAG: hypothetical protein QOG53_2003 [Frankiales bacterium]|nr:hypothetical protein [Frankiales bacterium]